MAKFCKPMGLYVTYLDCLECEGKECRQSHKIRKEEKEMKKIYLQVEPEHEVFLVFASKREGYKNDVIIKGKVTKATVYSNETLYTFEPIKIVTKTKEDLKNYVSSFIFANANIDTGLRSGFNRYPVFTTKEKCLEWLKNK